MSFLYSYDLNLLALQNYGCLPLWIFFVLQSTLDLLVCSFYSQQESLLASSYFNFIVMCHLHLNYPFVEVNYCLKYCCMIMLIKLCFDGVRQHHSIFKIVLSKINLMLVSSLFCCVSLLMLYDKMISIKVFSMILWSAVALTCYMLHSLQDAKGDSKSKMMIFFVKSIIQPMY